MLEKSADLNPGMRLRVAAHALLFVIGFSVVFIIGWGGAATILGQAFRSYKDIIAKLGGIVVILFGLSTLGVLRIPWLNYELRPEWKLQQRSGVLASFLMGVFFAAGWTPCIGTTLGAILTMSFSGNSSTQALVLTSGYALGLGIPFLLLGLSVDKVAGRVRSFRRYLPVVRIVSGIFLLAIGLLILANQMTMIAIWAQRNGFFLDFKLGSSAPNYLAAVFAGLISFLSPCVLPLIPAYLGYLSNHALKLTETAQVNSS